MSVYFQEEDQSIIVRGKTYPYRDLMRSLGGEYVAAEKTWMLPLNTSNLERIAELCKSVGGGRSKDPPPPQVTPTPATVLSTASTAAVGSEATPSQLAETTLDGLTISELMQKVQLVIAQGFPRSVWVLGEIQNIKLHASGIYFQLADFKDGGSRSATLTVNATLWRSQLADLQRKHGAPLVKELLQDGLRVRLLVDVTLYRDRGQISLQVQGLDPQYTKGSLALAREKLLRELRAKGLDRQNKSLSLPAFPLRIGLISAPESRAQSDFIDQLQLYKYPGEVIFYPSQMQGEKTLEEVVRGIKTLSEAACDVIVITRGGGSAADLRWFDSAEIAYAIAQCPLPVVAAIGHHEDVCIAEEICWQREKTPTAAADFIISLFQGTRQRLDQLGLILSQKLEERIRIQTSSLQNLREKILILSQRVLTTYRQHQVQLATGLEMQVERRWVQATGRLQNLSQDLAQRTTLRLQNQESRCEQLSGHLQLRVQGRLQSEFQKLPALHLSLKGQVQQAYFLAARQLNEWEKALLQRDPKPWMEQGWTQLSNDEGRVVRGAQLRIGGTLRARLPDALLELQIIDKQTKTQDKDHD